MIVRHNSAMSGSHEDKPKTVLVIDDDASTRLILKRSIERSGYAVQLAEQGDEALKMLSNVQPRFIVCDYRMPGLNGLQVLDAIRSLETHKTTPFVILSGETLAPPTDKYCRLLSKPIKANDLLQALSDLTGDASAHVPDELMAQMAKHFRSQLPKHLADLSQLIDAALHTSSALHDLNRKVHSLAGIGASYGFEWVTDVNRLLEKATENNAFLSEGRLTPQSVAQLHEVLCAMRDKLNNDALDIVSDPRLKPFKMI